MRSLGGARVYAEILGFGMSADAGDITASDPNGAARAMRAALKDARRNAGDVDYVNAHGTGTMQNDRSEAVALRDVFGLGVGRIAVSSSKAVLGHGLGAAGALEMAVTALAVRDALRTRRSRRHGKPNVAVARDAIVGGDCPPTEHVLAGTRRLARGEQDVRRAVAERHKRVDDATRLHDLHLRRPVIHQTIEADDILGVATGNDRLGGGCGFSNVQSARVGDRGR